MVRIMIMATMEDMTTTTMSELRMENQCTRPPGMRRYASQRDAQLMSLNSQYTSYVYTSLASVPQHFHHDNPFHTLQTL